MRTGRTYACKMSHVHWVPNMWIFPLHIVISHFQNCISGICWEQNHATFKLRCNTYNLKSPFRECDPEVLRYSQSCMIIDTNASRTFHLDQRPPYLLSTCSLFPCFHAPTSPWQPLICFLSLWIYLF